MNISEVATERSRLLDHQPGSADEIVREDGNPNHDDTQDEDDVPLAKEPSTRELLVLMGAIWMGVFFAALGI